PMGLSIAIFIAVFLSLSSYRVTAQSVQIESQKSTLTPSSLLATSTVTMTLDDALFDDLNANGRFDDGDTIEYTAVITAGANVTNVVLSIPLDANTTLSQTEGLDFKTTPIASQNEYDSIGNVGIDVPTGSGLLSNDSDPDGSGTLTVSAFDNTSVNGGAVVVQADGAFTYMPALGFDGVDTFSYTIQDTDGELDTAVVTINVSTPIWFVDNSQGSQGVGTLTSPYNTFNGGTGFNNNTNDEDGDAIFIYTGSGSYNGGVALRDDQIVIGQGASQSIVDILGISLPPFSNPLPATNGTNPEIINSSGRAFSLRANNHIQGLTVGETGNVAVNGSGFGDLTLIETSIIGSNKALNLITGGTVNIALDEVVVSNASNSGIQVQNMAGSISIGSLAITTTGGTGLSVVAAGELTITGADNSIVSTNGPAVEIRDTNIGVAGVTLNAVSASGGDTGIILDNTGSTGFFIVGPDAGAFGAGGTIQNISGDAIFLNEATNVAFRRLMIGNSAVNIGDGISANVNIDGNIIQAIEVTNLGLDTVKATQARDFGILGTRINGLAIYNSHFLDIGNADTDVGSRPRDVFSFMRANGEADVDALTGEVFIVNTVIDAFRHRAMTALVEGGGVMTATISNVTVSNNSTAVGADGFYFNSDELGTMITAVINNSTFTNLGGQAVYGRADIFSVLNLSLTNSGITGDGSTRGGAFAIESRSAATVGYTVSGNTYANIAVPDLFVLQDEGSLIGLYDDNTVTSPLNTINAINMEIDGRESVNLGVPSDLNFTMQVSNNQFDGYLDIFNGEYKDGGGQINLTFISNTVGANVAPGDDFIDLPVGVSDSNLETYGNVYLLVDNNQIMAATDRAIDLRTRDDADGIVPHTQDVGIHATITNNQISVTGESLRFRHQHPSAINGSCLDMSGNSGDFMGGTAITGDVLVQQSSTGDFDVVQGSELLLEQANPSSGTPATATITGVTFGAVANCTLPATPPSTSASSAIVTPNFDTFITTAVEEETAVFSSLNTPAETAIYQAGPQSLAVNSSMSGETILANLGNLDEGQIVIMTFYATIGNDLAISVDEFCTQGTVSAPAITDELSDDPATTDGDDATCSPRNQADVALSVIVTNEAGDSGTSVVANINETVTYTLSVTNLGPDTLDAGAKISEALPSDLTLVSFSATEGSTDQSNVALLEWTLGEMAFNETQTATIVATVSGTPTSSNLAVDTAVTDYDQHDSDESNNSSTATATLAGADLAIDISVDNALPKAGETMLYTLTITNLGADSTSSVIVDYALPSGILFSHVDSVSSGSYDDNTGEWALSDSSFDKDESHTLVIAATAPESEIGETITHNVAISNSAVADFIPSNNSDATQVTIQADEEKIFLPLVIR
ncbi:MAG: cadherin-like domain-containing protein, partial [Chloroflexota bacterium]